MTVSLRRMISVVPAVGVSVAPKLICPICSPAYAAILGALGLGFLTQTRYLFVLNLGLLAVSEFWLLFRAKPRNGYGPAFVGLGAAALVLAGKFARNSIPMLWTGIVMLLAAAVWHSLPCRRADSCSHCDEVTSEIQR